MGNYLVLRDGIEMFYKKDLIDEPKAIILINHGFAEHSGRYNYITECLNKKGYGVYRYDLRGHGQTKSPKGKINSYVDFILDCDEMVQLIEKENSNKPIYILGHSMGGFITCLYGIKHPNKLKGQILIGAAVNTLPDAKGYRSYLYEFMNIFMKNKMIKNPVSNYICKDEEVITEYVEDTLVLKEATLNFYVHFLVKGRKFINKNINKYNCPCLILHGKEDKIVPKDIAYYLYNNISSFDKRLKIYDDMYHEILNEKDKDKVIEDIIDWLEARR